MKELELISRKQGAGMGRLSGTREMMPTRISIAVPLENEEATLPELLRRIGVVLDGIAGGPHEVVIVDDGSTDRTRELLEDAAELDARIVGVLLSRNFGHQAALTAALDH